MWTAARGCGRLEGSTHPDNRAGRIRFATAGGAVARASVWLYRLRMPTSRDERLQDGGFPWESRKYPNRQGTELPRPLTADTWVTSPNVHGWVQSPCREAQSLDNLETPCEFAKRGVSLCRSHQTTPHESGRGYALPPPSSAPAGSSASSAPLPLPPAVRTELGGRSCTPPPAKRPWTRRTQKPAYRLS